jgi:hypothetical protein
LPGAEWDVTRLLWVSDQWKLSGKITYIFALTVFQWYCMATVYSTVFIPFRHALKASGLTLPQIDIVEINEAFAAQYLACEKELGLDPSKSNMNGGAIAIGHPLGERVMFFTVCLFN